MDYKPFVNYLYEIGILERIRHEGWIYVKIDNPEPVALHILRAAQIAMSLEKMEGLNEGEGVVSAVFHENGEARIGDLHKVARSYVEPKEEKAVQDQTVDLEDFGKEVYKLWKETEEKTTLRGKVGKDADHLELCLQAKFLMEQGYSSALQMWIDNASAALSTNSAKIMANEINELGFDAWVKKYLKNLCGEKKELLRRAHIAYLLNFYEHKIDPKLAAVWAIRGEKVTEVWQKDVLIIEECLHAYEGIDYRKIAWEEMHFEKEAYTDFTKNILDAFNQTDPDEFWYGLKNIVK